MAPTRRGGRGRSLAPPELAGALGTLLRTTLAQASAMRDALERGAREGRARLDDVRLERRRTDALADLGEAVLELVRRGELPELEEVPEVADAIAAIDELDERIEARDRGVRPRPARDRRVEPGRDWVAVGSRSRFDRRRKDAEDDGDGTVSSASWTPPRASQPTAQVWRPGEIAGRSRRDEPGKRVDQPTEPIRIESTKKSRGDATRPGHVKGGGGIVFGAADDDEDLKEYMHPDDVPEK
jgi:hypothetical protein